LDLDVTRVVVVYMLPMLVLGPYLAAIFWLNHIGMPLIGNTEAISFLEHQAITSRTVLSPKAMDWFFGGLNYQIEHHLFPTVPSFRLSRVQPIVQATLTQQSIAYQSAGFIEAVRAVARHFRQVAQTKE
jgi:fatty acid desaturase